MSQCPGSCLNRITNETQPFVDAVHEEFLHVYVLLLAIVVVKIILEFPPLVGGGHVVTDVTAEN